MKLSVVISNRNDLAMLSVTIRSCIEEMTSLPYKSEIVICDNSDPATYLAIKESIPSKYQSAGLVKFVRQDFPCLFTARESAIKNARGKYVLCLDSHMLCGRDSINSLVTFMDSRKDDLTLGFAHAPLTWAHQHESQAKHDRDMTLGTLSSWNNLYPTIRKITWKGMPWICRRDWFLDQDKGLNGYGALSAHRISWGGGDMHIGIKPWLLGFCNWAVPCRPFIHIGPFPKVDYSSGKLRLGNPIDTTNYAYRLYNASGNHPVAFGYLVSSYVLGGAELMKINRPAIERKFGGFIDCSRQWHKSMVVGQDEKNWLDKRRKMSYTELLEAQPWNE